MSADCVAYCFNNNVPNWFICGLNGCRDISVSMYSALSHVLCIINGNDPWGILLQSALKIVCKFNQKSQVNCPYFNTMIAEGINKIIPFLLIN